MTISHIELNALKRQAQNFFLRMLIFVLNIIKDHQDHTKERYEDVSRKISNCEERKTKNIMKCEEQEL